jgi:hypothetical protein
MTGAAYVIWLAWQDRGNAHLIDIHWHNTILVSLAALTIILWVRAARDHYARRLYAELRLIHAQVIGLTKEVKSTNRTYDLVQGQMVQITGRLDALAKRVDELHGDAYADGLAGRQLRDPKGDPTDSIIPQVRGVWLSKGN